MWMFLLLMLSFPLNPPGQDTPEPVVVSVETVPETGQRKQQVLKFEQFRRNMKMRASGSRVFLTDARGAPLDEAQLPSDVVDVVFARNRIHVATMHHGVFVFSVDWKYRLHQKSRMEVNGVVSRMVYDDPYLFVVQPVVSRRVYRLDTAGAELVTEGAPAPPPREQMAEKRESVTGRVIRIERGVAIVDVGSSSGFRAGDRIRVLSTGRHRSYNPLTDQDESTARLRLEAVLTLFEVEPGHSRARVGEGDDVRVGDFVQLFSDTTMPGIDRKIRWGGIHRVTGNLLPGFLVGDPMVGIHLNYEYQLDIPLTLGVGTRGFLASDATGTDFHLDAAFDTPYFSIGYRVGFLRVSSDNLDTSPMKGFSAMFIRLGMLDGLHFQFGYRTDMTEFRGLWGRLQLGGRRHNIFGAVDVLTARYKVPSSNSWEDANNRSTTFGTFLLGDRVRLWGNGGKDTMFVNLFLGTQFLEVENSGNLSFIIGGGFEYRF